MAPLLGLQCARWFACLPQETSENRRDWTTNRGAVTTSPWNVSRFLRVLLFHMSCGADWIRSTSWRNSSTTCFLTTLPISGVWMLWRRCVVVSRCGGVGPPDALAALHPVPMFVFRDIFALFLLLDDVVRQRRSAKDVVDEVRGRGTRTCQCVVYQIVECLAKCCRLSQSYHFAH